MRLHITRQMLGQWATLWCNAFDCFCNLNDWRSSTLGEVKLFEFKLKLSDLRTELFRLLAEHHTLEFSDEQSQALNLFFIIELGLLKLVTLGCCHIMLSRQHIKRCELSVQHRL
jgi:hypothetical protein